MKKELANYKITPKVVQSGISSTITILPRGDHARFDDSKIYLIRFVEMENSIAPRKDSDYDNVQVKPVNGTIKIVHTFNSEQMHLIRVILDDKTLFNFPIYSLYEDLYARRPYKGDLHVHTYHSDGHEEPGVVAANYRKHGFDFLAITDHRKWYPSKEAIEKYKDVPTDTKLFYGEEIHVHGEYIHAVNFGGIHSVNEYFYANEEKCLKEVDELANTLAIPKEIDAVDYARRYWIAEKIREFGGFAIFVHPHWICNAYHVPDKVSEYLFEKNIYDAFEVIGGQSVFENNMQTAMYYNECAKGRQIPIVGSSDSHGTEPAQYFCEQYTIVFSKDSELESLTTSIKDLYSVAVEDYENENTRVHGNYRMVKYGLFLVNEYFPLYEDLCYEQGRTMKDYITGEENACNILKIIAGRTDKFAKEFFGK